jgi:DNA-binding NarL/FixJ family response regulator
MRKTICFVFSKITNCSVILAAENGFDFIDCLQKAETRPSIVFLDVHMPILDGVSTAYYIKTHFPKIHVIALSNYSHHLVVQDMFDAGATAYLLKDNITEPLLNSVISNVLSGIPFIDPDIELGNFISIPERVSVSESANTEISKKEKTFLQLSATPLSIEQIAQLMNVATESIYNYQKSLKRKLGLCSRQELTVYALQHDIARLARYKTLKSSAVQKNKQ